MNKVTDSVFDEQGELTEGAKNLLDELEDGFDEDQDFGSDREPLEGVSTLF